MSASLTQSADFALSPKGHLLVDSESPFKAFASADILFDLARDTDDAILSPSASYWRGLSHHYMRLLCQASTPLAGVRPPRDWLMDYLSDIPPMKGSEYASLDTLSSLWVALDTHACSLLSAHVGEFQDWLHQISSSWNALGRVTFHLAENNNDPEKPFAFIATYTNRLSDHSKPQYIPLGNALKQYAGANNKEELLALLSPVRLAAQKSPMIERLVSSNKIFHPQAWNPRQAHFFLQNVEVFKECGILVRIPDWWKGGKGRRPTVSVSIGHEKPVSMGAEALLDFNATLSIDGEPLSDKEWRQLKAATAGLVFLRGKWVESNAEKLQEVLTHWQAVTAAREEGVSFSEAFRMLSGMGRGLDLAEDSTEAVREWSCVRGGKWMSSQIDLLRSTVAENQDIPGGEAFSLRPYQHVGVNWLRFTGHLGLGACLADDMGLGKTLQTIASLLFWRKENPHAPPALLVAPSTLLANWDAEIKKFAPSLSFRIAHPSEIPQNRLADPDLLREVCGGFDIVATSYGMISRLDSFSKMKWSRIILDEAQAIKNPAARQTKAVKKLSAPIRVALTGTPVENNLGDIWSLFDFLNPGLLGTAAEFSAFSKRLFSSTDPERFAPLRRLIQPFILRRLKTDKTIAPDLPDKIETYSYCSLTKRQVALYEQTVDNLAKLLEIADRKSRGGIILTHLLRFKQICNHPDQFTSSGAFNPPESGKFAQLRQLAEEIASRQEKVLVFTQFQSMTGPLHDFLAGVFGRKGLILDGSTKVTHRQGLVDEFQKEDGPPFFVLSIKAAGRGLTLTEATHVIHFDRWWNPSVENQATDRAFRIGQLKNVLVHKFVCRGTIEERIDELILSKMALSDDVLSDDGEIPLTAMTNSELIDLVSLDSKKALTEA
jgi:non-specific serine/threonine protein kinase